MLCVEEVLVLREDELPFNEVSHQPLIFHSYPISA